MIQNNLIQTLLETVTIPRLKFQPNIQGHNVIACFYNYVGNGFICIVSASSNNIFV